MITKELCKAVTEINLILKYADEKDVERIPKGLRMFFNEIADKEYEPNIDPDISLYEQTLLEETKQILAMLYEYYWDEEKIIKNEIFQNNVSDNLFKEDNMKHEIINENRETFEIAKKEPWYKKLFGWFKKNK